MQFPVGSRWLYAYEDKSRDKATRGRVRLELQTSGEGRVVLSSEEFVQDREGSPRTRVVFWSLEGNYLAWGDIGLGNARVPAPVPVPRDLDAGTVTWFKLWAGPELDSGVWDAGPTHKAYEATGTMTLVPLLSLEAGEFRNVLRFEITIKMDMVDFQMGRTDAIYLAQGVGLVLYEDGIKSESSSRMELTSYSLGKPGND